MLSILLIGIGILWILRSWRLNQGKCFIFHDWYTVEIYSQGYDTGSRYGWQGENKICRRCPEKINTIPWAKKAEEQERISNDRLKSLANCQGNR